MSMVSAALATYPLILESLAEARSYSCLMGQLPSNLSRGIFALQSRVDPKDLKNPTFEAGEQPHVIVLYGLHTHNPDDVYSQIKRHGAIRPVTLRLGKLDVFRHRDQDVLKVNVESPDLEHLHKVVKHLPNSFTFPNYNPHVTVSYLHPGRGEKYLGLSNPLEGREVTIGGLVFSTPDKKYSYVPLRAPKVEDIVELVATWGFNEGDLLEMTTAMAVGTSSRPFGFARPVYPSFKVKELPPRRSSVRVPEASEGAPSRHLTEKPYDDPGDFVNYTGIPYHLQVMDSIEGEGWEHVGDGPRHSIFHHEHHPGVEVHVVRRDEHPIWTVRAHGADHSGSDIPALRDLLGSFPEEEPMYDDH